MGFSFLGWNAKIAIGSADVAPNAAPRLCHDRQNHFHGESAPLGFFKLGFILQALPRGSETLHLAGTIAS
jgi:hypothetical protein